MTPHLQSYLPARVLQWQASQGLAVNYYSCTLDALLERSRNPVIGGSVESSTFATTEIIDRVFQSHSQGMFFGAFCQN